jgi:hypothetical protein
MVPIAIGTGTSPPDSYRERSGKERLRMQPFLILPSYSSNARDRRGGCEVPIVIGRVVVSELQELIDHIIVFICTL